jgi:signal transduction histidine kinase
LPRYVAAVAAVALAYVLYGRLGLMLDAVGGFATLVWAPTGISIAALVLGGSRLWPGVALGALATNLWAGAPVAAALGIAAGNTLEALAATWALRRIPGFRPALDRIQDALGLIVLAAGISPIISATIGTLTLHATGVIPRALVAPTWGAWWLGDAIGALVVAPLILGWGAADPPRRNYPRLELCALIAATTGMALFIFFGQPRAAAYTFLQPYLLGPVLIWAALRFDTRITALAVFLVSALAVWGTVTGRGPFQSHELHERLRSLQAFISLLAPTLLVLAAVAADRRRAEAALRAARDAAEEASRAKSRFLAVMSHELRTPLTGIMGYAELMASDVGGKLSDRHREFNERIVWSAQYLVSLIEGVLSFSRADAGREEVRLQQVPVDALVREAIGVVEPVAATRGLRVNAAPSGIELTTDPAKVRQILLNLLGNAVKFSSDSTIDVRVLPGSTHVDIAVADHGVGVPPEDRERIFEPFTQLDDGGRSPHAGTGLGLSVSRTFARLLGGDILLESAPGAGSVFTLRLPYDRHGGPDVAPPIP